MGAPAAAAAVECPVKPGEQCWFWRAVVEGAGGGLRDASALPSEPRAHAARINKNLWGPRWARLCPARLVEVRGPHALIREQDKEKPERLPASLLLLWYEGLLVLDSVSKAGGTEVPWLTESLRAILESERAKYKYGQLSACLYSQKYLMNVAATGPQFYGSDGTTFAHRRQLQAARGVPSETEATEGWYKVTALAEYLPPWEAFTHPKCGLYQDFYMVEWGPPHDKEDYSKQERGCDTKPGATWEPDECLPEDLDALRATVKKRWADQQKDREGKEREQCEAAQQLKRKEIAREEDAKKRARQVPLKKYNPMDLQLIKDMALPQRRHGVHVVLDSIDEGEIKKGWPKSADEFPEGYGACDPPGCCGSLCDCMEDWHLGRRAPGMPWVDTPQRTAASDAAVQAFAKLQDHVQRRGQFSGMHYLEPITDRFKRKDITRVAGAAGFGRLVKAVLREAAQRVPLAALISEQGNERDGWTILRMLADGFSNDEVHPDAGGPFMPLQMIVSEPLAWLSVHAGTGEVSVIEDKVPQATDDKKQVSLKLELTSMIPGKSDRMECDIGLDEPEIVGGNIWPVTSKIITKCQRLEDNPVLQEIVMDRLSCIYDFAGGTGIETTFGRWLQSIWEVGVATRAVSVSQVLEIVPEPTDRRG